ncbi:MAG: hypothetical protein AAGB22_09250, partial [Bacteroidota bacterium]
LGFTFKSINGLPEMALDTTREDKNHWKIALDEMPAQEAEPSATNEANLQGVLYKLSINTVSSAFDIASFGEMSKIYHQVVYVETGKSTRKKLQALIKESGAKEAADQEGKIRRIEQTIKANYASVKNGPQALSTIDGVLENKAGSPLGLVRLYAALFELLEVEHQLVLTCDRRRMHFDPEFESYGFLEVTLFYFPKTKAYLAPTFETSRYGLIPFQFTHQNGLFIRSLSIGGIVTGIGKVKHIPAVDYAQNLSNIYLTMRFPDGPDEAEITMENQVGGYMAAGMQVYYEQLPDKEKQELLKSLIGYIFGESEPEDIAVEHASPEDLGVRPMVLKTTVTTADFIEKAGPKYLIKVGDLIGQQVEMYEQKDREQPIDDRFNRLFHRELTLELPEGYRVVNPEALNINVAHKEEGETILQFISEYQLDGNVLKVTIHEYYSRVQLPAAVFDAYKAVVNAAADFNKVTLFLEPVQ